MIQVQTTTEELIVAYLDGELQRKELEVVLFERLATTEEARELLREHLILRGAIRHSASAPQFELSSDLDQRTRSRIEEMLRNVPVLEEVPVLEHKALDAAPVQTTPATRSLKRWALRPSYALAALLFAIGGTWFITNSVTKQDGNSLAVNTPQVSSPQITAPTPGGPETLEPEQSNNSTPTTVQKAIAEPGKEHIVYKTVVKYVPAKNTTTTPANLAMTSDVKASTTENVDPAAMMISHRYGKMLKSKIIR